MWQIHRELTPSDQVSATARSLTSGWLSEVLDPKYLDADRAVGEAALIVSELVTNAVEAHTEYLRLSLRVESEDPTLVRIAVEDDAPGTPRLEAGSQQLRERGRGLMLVDALAARWGTRWHAPHKSVWADLAVAAARPWPGLRS